MTIARRVVETLKLNHLATVQALAVMSQGERVKAPCFDSNNRLILKIYSKKTRDFSQVF